MGENFYTDLATVPIIIIQQQQQRLAAVATSQQLSSTTRRPPLPSTADNFTRNALPIITPPPLEAGGAEYCDERVCVLCPRAYLHNYMSNLHQISVHVTYDRRSAPFQAALRYVICFRFYGRHDVISADTADW